MKAKDFIIAKNSVTEAVTRGELVSFKNMLKYADLLVGRRKEKFVAAINDTIAEYASDQLYNAAYKERWSYDITRALEAIWSDMVDKNRSAMQPIQDTDRDAYWDLLSFNAQSVAKMLRIVTKHRQHVPALMFGFLKDLEELKADQAKIKAVLKSGKKPAEPKPGAFIKPMAGLEASRKAKRIADEAVAMFRQELLESTKNAFLNSFARITRPGLTYEEVVMIVKAGGLDASMVQRFIKPNKAKKTFEYMPGNNRAEVIRLAERQTNDIIDGFVGKSVSKLALIFEKKTEIAEYKITRTIVNQGMVDAVMFIRFSDESRFTVYSQVEYSYSVHGKLFLRYPMRFTEVYFADGTRMTQPSEEKMIKTF